DVVTMLMETIVKKSAAAIANRTRMGTQSVTWSLDAVSKAVKLITNHRHAKIV
ncbi:hypothetical protein ElyMa_006710100, partial [Elysia marginata]